MPSLWQRLWALAPEAVIASLLALAAWIWHVNVRFGEPQPRSITAGGPFSITLKPGPITSGGSS